MQSSSSAAGPSPRRRGNPPGGPRSALVRGTIPAQAGQPVAIARLAGAVEDHPRAGGATRGWRLLSTGREGPSPRRRGNHRPRGASDHGTGTIPAQAGQPPDHRPVRRRRRDHPRAGGATNRTTRPAARVRGPSPRRRGNLAQLGVAHVHRRTIPAQAGQPGSATIAARRRWDHPRAGGATTGRKLNRLYFRGPSPRRRGNLDHALHGGPGVRTIPAQAGQPSWTRRTSSRSADHPRAGGATVAADMEKRLDGGPSPRRRGNQLDIRLQGRVERTIPAQAGQPDDAAQREPILRDHPRAGGATAYVDFKGRDAGGPSPRRRGNPKTRARAASSPRTIPAQAGQPSTAASVNSTARDHPRAGGATYGADYARLARDGPSPRRRGNHVALRLGRRHGGTIPAQAGQPKPA